MHDLSAIAKRLGSPDFPTRGGSRAFDPREDISYRITQVLDQMLFRLGIARHQHQPLSRWFLLLGLMLASGLALALGVVAVNAYRDTPAAPYEAAVATRVASPVYDARSVFLGAVSDYSGELDRNWSYLPLDGDPPKPFVDALLFLEDRSFLQGGGLRFCGSDIVAVIGRSLLTGLRAGGSGATLQLQKALEGPTKDPEEFRLAAKVRQIGRSCGLWDEAKELATRNGTTPQRVIVQRYAELVPFLNGAGSVNGLTAAAQILYGKGPDALSVPEQYLLAASLKYSLQLASPPDLTVSCQAVLGGDFAYASATSGEKVRRNHCQIAQRALYAAQHNLDGEDLRAFTEAHEHVLKQGFVPVNPFAGKVARGKLINMTSRSQVMLGNAQTAVVRGELERQDHAIGDSIHLTIDGGQNVAFRKEAVEALDRIQKSPGGQETLCMRLVGSGPRLFNPLCANGVNNSMPDDAEPEAQWLAVSMQAQSGEIRKLALSDPAIWENTMTVGSFAKVVIALAWTAAGHSPAESVCAQQAQDGKRPLHRSHRPTTGYTPKQCGMGIGTMSFAKAFSTSDNLAMLWAARVLGDAALKHALDSLKLHVEHDPIAFATAFGTATGRPLEILASYGALFVASQDKELPVQLSEPTLVVPAADVAHDTMVTKVRQMVDTPEKRANLRTILSAPVEDGGTLAYLNRHLGGGKTGTVGSSHFTANHERTIHSKLIIGHTANNDAIGLVVVSSPTPSRALALPGTGHSLIYPLQRLTLAPVNPKERISQFHKLQGE
jgi:hypothetical protein